VEQHRVLQSAMRQNRPGGGAGAMGAQGPFRGRGVSPAGGLVRPGIRGRAVGGRRMGIGAGAGPGRIGAGAGAGYRGVTPRRRPRVGFGPTRGLGRGPAAQTPLGNRGIGGLSPGGF
jgi:hypothetical protein